MGIRQIRVNDDPILRKVSRPVESFDAKLFKLLDDIEILFTMPTAAVLPPFRWECSKEW